MVKKVIKRDGRRNKFNPSKIENAIKNAFNENGQTIDDNELDKLIDDVTTECDKLEKTSIDVETIQDIVENVLMNTNKHIAKAFILFRKERERVRNTKSEITKTIKEIKESDISSSNILRDNANESGATPAGAFGKVASETNKMYNLLNVIDRRYADLHSKGYLHIHDLNYYDLSFNCLFAPIGKLLKKGFDSGTGFIRQPKSIQTAAQLTAVILQLQSNQQYGGIASANLDFELAPYVNLSFVKNLAKELAAYERYHNDEWGLIKNYDKEQHEKEIRKTLEIHDTSINKPLARLYELYNSVCVDAAIAQTDKDTFQAMEGLIHNLNSLQSRSGNQVPFSSLNFGLDTSKAGRMVSANLIKAQMAGLGDGLTAIFPILIFKLMKGVSYLPTDPNYDLKMASLKCLARRFYPNFVGVDNKFNAPYIKYDYLFKDLSDDDEIKVIGSDDITTWGKVKSETHKYPVYEIYVNDSYWEIENGNKLRRLRPETTISTMGCRTRVIGNVNGPEQTTGRGNFAFHTLNLPKLAIQAHIEENTEEERIKLFFKKLNNLLEDAKGSLLDRFNIICKKTYENFPFTMQQGLYLTSDDEPHSIHDTIGEVLKQSTLSIGYCGLYETILCLTGKTWGKDADFDLGYNIIKTIYDFCKKTQKETHLNWSCFATPAEATAGRFCNIDKNIYNNNPKLADIDSFQLFGKGYYTNSHMLPFDLKTNLMNKIKWEAPFHEITTAGHIFYHKIDGDLSQNLDAVGKCIDTMYENDMGYFTVTMDSDTCIHEDENGNICGFHGVINGECPKCGNKNEDEIVRVRRITGYLTGSPKKSITKAWNDGKLKELDNRINI